VRVTIPCIAFVALAGRSNTQGRCLANLAAYLLENSLQTIEPRELQSLGRCPTQRRLAERLR